MQTTAIYTQVGKDTTKPPYNRRIWCCVLSQLVVVSLLLSVFTCVYYFKFIKMEKTRGSNCVPCSNIEPAPKDEESMRLYKSLGQHPGQDGDVNGMRCCAETKTQGEALVQLLSNRISHKTSALENATAPSSRLGAMKNSLSNSLAFAQKSLCVQKEVMRSHVPNNKVCLLNIQPEKTLRYELTRGVDLTQTGIKIIYPGLYFVYKSINFLPDSNKPCKFFSSQTFQSFLIRNNKNHNTTLVKNEHTCCPDCLHNSETGFAGGVFQLEKGDLIQVEVTGEGIVHVGRDVTYVGLMMMGGQQT